MARATVSLVGTVKSLTGMKLQTVKGINAALCSQSIDLRAMTYLVTALSCVSANSLGLYQVFSPIC